MDFGFGLPKECDGNTGIVVFVDRLCKMAHLAAVPDSIDGKGTAMLFIYRLIRQHGLPLAIISDRDLRFTGKFCTSIFKVLGKRLDMSTADHPMVRLSELIASLATFFKVFVLSRLRLGARCSLSLSLS